MTFSDTFIEELISRNPIEEVAASYVSLHRSGNRLMGLCPFHNEKTPSFSISPDVGLFYCFGCHKGGSVIQFIMEAESLDYPDAVAFLARRAGMELPEEKNNAAASTYKKKERLWDLCRDAARFYHSVLKSPEGSEGFRYLEERGMDAKTISHFGLGFAPNEWDRLLDAMTQKGYSRQDLLDAGLILISKSNKNGESKERAYDRFRNRVMFPIIDVRGNIIGFGGRVMDGSQPKYLNSPETLIFNKRKNLFALNYAKKSKMGYLVLTEGYMDTISMHQYGFDCAVASLGTSLTDDQARLLSKYTKQIVLCYDGDAAGQSASNRAIRILENTGVTVRVLRMRGAKDPDEFLHKYGADAFSRLLGNSEGQTAYRLNSLISRYDMKDDTQRVAFLQEAARLLSSLPSAVERDIYAARAAEVAGVTQDAMNLEIKNAYKRTMRREARKAQAQNMQPAENFARSLATERKNTRSAVAEEKLLSQLFLEPSLLDQTRDLSPGDFTISLYSKVYTWMEQREKEDKAISVPLMAEAFSAEEMAQIARLIENGDTTVNEKALHDYKDVIITESEKRQHQDLASLLSRRRAIAAGGGNIG